MRLVFEPDVYTSDEEVEKLSQQLRRELRSSDIDALTDVSRGSPPPNAKGGTAPWVAEWLITLSEASGALTTTVALIKDWLSRRTDKRLHKVIMVIDGDTLEVSSATSAEQAALIRAFIQRHASD